MTRVKLCGLRREEDAAAANELLPEYIGFVFDDTERRYISPEKALILRGMLDPEIISVGVFVNAPEELILDAAEKKMIGMIQLHGNESDAYIKNIREKTALPVIKAFKITCEADTEAAKACTADYILLDSGMGTGRTFDHSLIKSIGRDYFLAGGLTPENVGDAVRSFRPFAADASSSLETNGFKDKYKMKAFVDAVRKENTDD